MALPCCRDHSWWAKQRARLCGRWGARCKGAMNAGSDTARRHNCKHGREQLVVGAGRPRWTTPYHWLWLVPVWGSGWCRCGAVVGDTRQLARQRGKTCKFLRGSILEIAGVAAKDASEPRRQGSPSQGCSCSQVFFCRCRPWRRHPMVSASCSRFFSAPFCTPETCSAI